MPYPILTANQLTSKLSEVRKSGVLPFLKPDGKVQISTKYENNQLKEITDIVISAHHFPEISQKDLKEALIEEVVKTTINKELLKNTNYYINNTGLFVIGGPQADTGFTGRKNIMDSYGGVCPHGGGAFSGKDPTKSDRSGAYMARYIAKNLVGAGVADEIILQLAFVIGEEKPISIMVDGKNLRFSNQHIIKAINTLFDLSIKGIIEKLNLLEPIYKKTATCGHFGKDEFSWEKLDMIEQIKEYFKIF
jgi:S-adenosylmethionine synthetase